MSVHDETHERRLERWVAEEELSLAEQRELQDCAECSAKRAEFEAVARELQELGAKERDAQLAAASEATPPAWEDRALGSLRAAMEGRADEKAARGPRRGRLLALLALAAAAVVLLFVFRPEPLDGPEVERSWLGPELADMSPAGRVSGIERFTWTHDTPELGTYRIRLFRPGEDEPFSTAKTSETRWEPESPATLPDHFFWEVEAFDALGKLIAYGREEVRWP